VPVLFVAIAFIDHLSFELSYDIDIVET